MTTTGTSQRTRKTAKEELPDLLAQHDPPISRNKLSRLLDISLGHVTRACSPRHRERFSGEVLGRVALLLGLPEDYFLEYRYAYVARRMLEDGAICDRVYDLLRTSGDEEPGVRGLC